MEVESKEQPLERRGKSWKREREERGRRLAAREVASKVAPSKEDPAAAKPTESHPEDVSAVNVVVEENKSQEMVPENNNDKNEDEEQENMEDEERRRQEEMQSKEEERQYLQTCIADAEDRLRLKTEARMVNITVTRPEESYFTKLDSSLKKNTAFVRKLKTFTENQKDSLMKDMSTLNLTKYVSEVAAAIVEAKLKMSDITAAVALCSELHQKYAEFPIHLLDNWQKNLALKKDDKISNPSKLRVDLRFYAELIASGVFTLKEGLPLLGNVLTMLVSLDKEEHNNISIVLSFCRHCGEDYAGLVPRKIRLLAEEYKMQIPRSDLLTIERQKNVRQLLKDYYTSLCKHLVKEFKELKAFERQNQRILRMKGELSSERRERAEVLHVSHQKLFANTQQFAEVLDEDMPELPEDELSKQEDTQLRLEEGDGENESNLNILVWEDEDTRCFYESLPDLKAFLPSILYKDSAQAAAQPEEKEEEQLDDELDIEELEGEVKADEGENKKEEEIVLPPEIEEFEEPEPNISASSKILLDAFLTHLPNCINREVIDNAAVEFVMNLNTKHNRKKLVKTLFSVPRTRLDLLPFYGRLVAILHPCMPEVGSDLAHLLKQDFRYHVKKKDQINIESKIKVVRFIGELVKFRMFSKVEALYCLKMLLFDFRHHHIEMACNLLETCGRFLYHGTDSHHRTKVFLELIMRKKSVTALDSRYVTMIENAYYYVNPPEVGGTSVRKERPPMHEYVRKLLYRDLGRSNTEKVLRQMRKLDWEDPDLAAYAVKCLTSVSNVKFYNIRCMASLLSGLVAHQVTWAMEFVGPQVVDGVLEEIRVGMEINLAKFCQRRVAMVKYLGELYNYRMVESSVIFQTLYSFIVFGVSNDPAIMSELDPPEHLFRIRLACVLLETCGQYFNSGSSKKKLDYYFIFFQRYYWLKKSNPLWTEENPFPVAMEYLVKDTLLSLRSKMHLFQSLEEAQKAVADLEAEYTAKIAEVLPLAKAKGEGGSADEAAEDDGGGAGLSVIRETEEEEEDMVSDADPLEMGEGDWENTGESLSQSQSQHSQPTHPEEDALDARGMDEGLLDLEADDDEGDRDGEDEEEGEREGNTLELQDDFTLPGAPKHLSCPEDSDFMSAFDRMVSENIQDRLRETVRAQQLDISVPYHIKTGLKKTYEQLQEPETEVKPTVNFVLMMRKGNKQQYKNLAVPLQSELAQNLKNREEAERAEKERVKRLTLDINERLEEEDYQEMQAQQAQRPIVMNLNRERRQKYQHPKGAPDADLIFGPKKVR